MAVGKEIRTKVKSVQNTQKITRAMEMVAASKMRKAQERMAASRPYAQKIRNVIKHLAHAHPEYKHTYLQDREVKRVGYIVVSSDRGLCGGLNANLFRAAIGSLKQWDTKGVGIDICAVRSKASAFLKRLGGNAGAETRHPGNGHPGDTDLLEVFRHLGDGLPADDSRDLAMTHEHRPLFFCYCPPLHSNRRKRGLSDRHAMADPCQPPHDTGLCTVGTSIHDTSMKTMKRPTFASFRHTGPPDRRNLKKPTGRPHPPLVQTAGRRQGRIDGLPPVRRTLWEAGYRRRGRSG